MAPTLHTTVNLSTHFEWLGPLPNFKLGACLIFQVQLNVNSGTGGALPSSSHMMLHMTQCQFTIDIQDERLNLRNDSPGVVCRCEDRSLYEPRKLPTC